MNGFVVVYFVLHGLAENIHAKDDNDNHLPIERLARDSQAERSSIVAVAELAVVLRTRTDDDKRDALPIENDIGTTGMSQPFGSPSKAG